jgi:hypothetical protein
MIWDYYHFKKWNIEFTRIKTFLKIHIYSKMMKKKHVMYLDNYKHLV